MATLLNSSQVFIPVGNRDQEGKASSHPGAGGEDYRLRRLRQNQLGGARRVEPTGRTLITGGITITMESQVLPKLSPQASASAESPGSRRSHGPANRQEEGKKTLVPTLIPDQVVSAACL